MRALVLMSGGVDSTVAAYLLVQENYEVEGITFWLWSFPGAPDYQGRTKCCSLDQAALAARELGISHRTIDASSEFYELVLRDFVARYRCGETPNPCGRCNRYLRFPVAFRYAKEHGFDHVVTGHHVRILCGAGGRRQLHRGRDPKKDQSYFLYGLSESDLGHLRFPVGEMKKEEVFALARRAGLYAASLSESQDLCFARAGRTDFLFSDQDFRPGPILDLNGNKLGEHKGLINYTIGQRRGLGIASRYPLYVIAIDKQRNALIVGKETDLYSVALEASEANFISGSPPPDEAELAVKIRYRSPAFAAIFHPRDNSHFSIEFSTPQRAVTPGQIVALYDGDRLLGGGTIARAIRR